MNLKYILENDIAEKFLFGQLSDQEKSQYEEFLKNSKEAQQDLEKNRLLIQTVKRAGNKEMREEIRKQAELVKKPEEAWTLLLKVAAVIFLFALTPTVIYLNFYQKTTDLPAEIVLSEKTAVDVSESEKTEQEKINLPPAKNKKSEKTSMPVVKDDKQKQTADINEKVGVQTPAVSKEKSVLADIISDDLEMAESVPDISTDETTEPDISDVSGLKTVSSAAGNAAKMSKREEADQMQRSATKYMFNSTSAIKKNQDFENEKYRLFLNPVLKSSEQYPDSLTYKSLKRDKRVNIYLDVTPAFKDLKVANIKQFSDSKIEISFYGQASYLLDPDKKEGKAFRKK